MGSMSTEGLASADGSCDPSQHITYLEGHYRYVICLAIFSMHRRVIWLIMSHLIYLYGTQLSSASHMSFAL